MVTGLDMLVLSNDGSIGSVICKTGDNRCASKRLSQDPFPRASY